MENTMAFAAGTTVHDRNLRLRVGAVIAAITLVFAMFALVQDRADAAPNAAPAAASVASPSGDAAQINFGQIFCSILISVRNAFANTPFGGFVTPILNSLIQGFGCAPS